jgi:hypothetical protein
MEPGTEPPQEPPSQSQRPWWAIVALGILGALALFAIIGALTNSGGGSGTEESTETVTVEVQTDPADLCWSGAFGDRTVEGCGSDTVPLKSDIGIYSANAQKQSDGLGTLTLILKINGEEVDKTSTSAAYGIASVTGQAR